MTISIGILLLILAGAIFLFSTEKLPVDSTSILIMVLLMITGLVTPSEGISGFSHVGTLSVFTLLVLSVGLQSTGAVGYLGDITEKYASKGELKSLIFISFIAGIPSAFLNNTAIVAILLPVVIRLSEISGVNESKLLMPLSFAAMAGGSVTIIGTSTNVIVSSIHETNFGTPFSIFEFSLLGIILFFAYLIYMLLIGRYLLPDNKKELTSNYELQDFLLQIKILENSPLVGKTIIESGLDEYRIRTLEIIRDGGEIASVPDWDERLKANDQLLIKAQLNTLIENKRKLGIEINKEGKLDETSLSSENAMLFQAVIGNNSFLLGKKIKEIDFKELFGAVPLAIRRHGEALNQKVSEIELRFGDTILMEARRKNLDRFSNSRDFIVLEKIKKSNFRSNKMIISCLIVLAVVLLASTGILDLVVAGFLGVSAMYLTGCVSPKYVYQKVEWRIFFLLAGVIPLGIAVEKTGLGELIANSITQFTGTGSPQLVIAMLFALTVLLTSIMSNNATAVLLAPIAISLSAKMGINPKALLVTVMFASSTSFLTPIGYQTNTLVYGPGRYKFIDYFKVGGILTLIFWILSVILIPIFYM